MTNATTAPATTDTCCLCGTSGRFKGDSYNSRTEACPLACAWVALADERDAANQRRARLAGIRNAEAAIARDLAHLANPHRIRNASTNERSLGNLIGSVFSLMAATDRAVNA